MAEDKQARGAKETPTFDERMARLETIVAELEDGGLGLENSIGRYKEGVELLRGCRKELEGFRKQVEELDAEGARPYEGDPDVAGDPE